MPHLLLVDDEAEVLEFMRFALQDAAGHRITTALNGEAALSVLEQDRPDLALLDVVMSGLSGIDVARRAAECDVPVLFMTGGALSTDDVLSPSAPGIPKPFRLDDVFASIDAALADKAENLRLLRATLREIAARRDAQAVTTRARTHTFTDGEGTVSKGHVDSAKD
jgi:two-component system sensor histidine kinase ChiS